MGEQIETKLAVGEMQEAWRLLKGWYRVAEDRAPKPCYKAMAKQTSKRAELYARVQPPGEPIPINIQPFDIDDLVPKESKIQAVVRGLRNGRAGGVSGIKAKHIKQWMWDMVKEEEQWTAGHGNIGNKWRLFVELVQFV